MSTMLTPESCREYLKAVIDPEIYQNIVDLGLVYDIAVDENDIVDVSMTLTTPMCPLGPQIIADVEQTLEGKGANDVNVAVVWEPMWTPDMMTDDLKRELGMFDAEEPELPIDPPPPPLPPKTPKRSGLFWRLFGR